MLRFDDPFQVFFKGKLDVEIDDIGAGNHQRTDLAIIEAEDIAHHVVLLALDHAGLGTFFEHGLDFFLGDALRFLLALTHQAQDGVGGEGEQTLEGPRHQREEVHRPGDQAGDALGVELGDTLGYQFADDDGDIGDHHDHQAGGGDAACLRVETQCLQLDRQRYRQDGFADNAVEDADRGDADLDRGQEACRLVVQFDRDGGGAVAILRQPRQAGAPCRDEGDLGHGESAVDQHEGNQEQDFHGAIRRDPVEIGMFERLPIGRSHDPANPFHD